ncbi:hypothetical protein [Amycolatopsis regifaucium]|nr:hypothetical protein [Amycolatopsis regifaucium]SFJ04178.1 hypothetical protein SAMN04489731_11534 [Amycolatopsis regifaucium]
MGTEKEYRELFDRVAALRGRVAGKLANELGSDPNRNGHRPGSVITLDRE